MLKGVQHLAVGAQHVDAAALALEVLFDEHLVGAPHEDVQPLPQTVRIARDARPAPVAQVFRAERRACLHHHRQRELTQHVRRLGWHRQDEVVRHRDADLATHLVAALLVVADAVGAIAQQVDARVRLQVGSVLLQRDDGGIVGRDHQVEALALAEIQERPLPGVVTRPEGRQFVHGVHVTRAPGHLDGGAPRDVHLDALAAERPDDGQEARVALAEHEDFAAATHPVTREATSSNTPSTARACALMSNSSATRARAARAMAVRRCGSSSSATMADARTSGSRGGTSTPVLPSTTISHGPPSRGAITGRLAAMASSRTRPNGSRLDAWITRCAASMHAATSRRAPVSSMWPARSGAAIRSFRRSPYSAPRRWMPPTTRQRSSGIRRRARATASATRSCPFHSCTCPTMTTSGAAKGMPSSRRTAAPPPLAKRPTSMPS